LSRNSFQVFPFAQITSRLVKTPPSVFHMTQLTVLRLCGSECGALPPTVSRLQKLFVFDVSHCKLTSVPPELGSLQALGQLHLNDNQLRFVPLELEKLPLSTKLFLFHNPLPFIVDTDNGSQRLRLREIFEATSWSELQPIRRRCEEVCVALQDLDLPALVTLEIIDAAFVNSIPMHLKWNLVTAVKHFRQRGH